MDETAGEILFAYLRDILFYPNKASLDTAALPPAFQDLGEGLTYLLNCMKESQAFVGAISRGELSVKPPSVENPIAGPVKELQGSLRHIVWQVDRVASGDYKQRIDFMGDLSASFNVMIEQLAERTARLEQARLFAEEKNKELLQAQQLQQVLMDNMPEYVMVIDVLDGHIQMLNRSAVLLQKKRTAHFHAVLAHVTEYTATHPREIESWKISVSADETADAQDAAGQCYYAVSSYPVLWGGHKSLAHILRDTTQETIKEQHLIQEAMYDPLTGLFNRRRVMEILEDWYANKIPFSVAILDVDFLKYCNDALGHDMGDFYLTQLSRGLKEQGGGHILARIGGDEFLVAARDESGAALSESIGALREQLMHGDLAQVLGFTPCFSFGIAENIPCEQLELGEILKQADVEMYQYKQINKPKLNVNDDYVDTRLS